MAFYGGYPNISPSSPPMGEMRRKGRRDRKKAAAGIVFGPPAPLEVVDKTAESVRLKLLLGYLGIGR